MAKYLVAKSDLDSPNQISLDEPCFVIRATDKFAPDIVAAYYFTLAQRGGYSFPLGDTDRQAFLGEIAAHLARIHKWQAENPNKVKYPD